MNNQHLDSDKAQDECQAVVQEYEAVGHVCQQEIHCAQAEDGEDVGGEDDERVGGNGKNGRNTVDGEYDITQFDHNQYHQQRAGNALAVFHGKEFFTVQ